MFLLVRKSIIQSLQVLALPLPKLSCPLRKKDYFRLAYLPAKCRGIGIIAKYKGLITMDNIDEAIVPKVENKYTYIFH